ncbi:hypothetical protein CSPX01_06063 [Colletotrichum filicis]|nr:hypothetical protein CSPX01_06063 [Colletotrichum filicis]
MAPKRNIDINVIFKSRLIVFVIGENEVEYNVHEAAISGLSAPLRALVTNGMKESVEGVVIWDEVEPEVFTQLVEFAYSHDLSLHDYDMIEKPKNRDTDEAAKESRSLQQRLWKEHCMKEEIAMPELRFGKDRFKISHLDDSRAGGRNRVSVYHSEEYFMAHARLYCLADQYGITDLAEVCVEKLQTVLYEHPVNDVLNEAICKLLLFVWPRTMPKDELRLLLIDYILTNLSNALTKNMTIFGPVLDKIPEIAVAILRSAPDQYWQALKRRY